MKIAVVAPSPSPFVVGGAEKLWWSLVEHLNAHTPHEAELLKLPTPEHDLPSLVDSYERFSLLRVTQFDLVISGKYPAWMVAHPRHVVYMLHRLRGLYDAYGGAPQVPRAVAEDARVAALRGFMARAAGQRSALPEFFGRVREALAHASLAPGLADYPGPFAREIVHWLDRVALAPAAIERFAAISHAVARRQDYFPAAANVRVAWPPSPMPEIASTGADYFFTTSRLDGPKRIELLIDAMRHSRCGLPLFIAGDGPLRSALAERAAGNPRIRLLGRQSESALASLYAGALAVPFVPYDEDYGLVAIEAMRAGKPVITTHDAGGTRELIADGDNGIVCAPEAAAIGAAMDRLADDRDWASALGAAGRRRAAAITWDAVVAELVPTHATPSSQVPVTRTARKLVVATTFGIDPPRHGGQSRVFHFYRNLYPDCETTVVSFGPAHGESFDRMIAPGLREVRVAKSPEHDRRELLIQQEVGLPVTDVVMPELSHLTPAFAEALLREAADADAVVACHPYLFHELASLGVPLWYEAQDVEWKLKSPVLSTTGSGAKLLASVREIEERCATAAELILCASHDDAADLTALYAIDPARVVVVPNGTDCSRILYSATSERIAAKDRMGLPAQPLALFMGSGHWPNIEAVHHLLRVAAELPGVVFTVIGSVCEAFAPTARHRNVLLLGEVDDVTRNLMLEVCDVALNPMEHGSGTSLKILDFFAAGIPVLSTPLGARGIGAIDGVHCRLAPIEGFGLALGGLLATDPDERDAMTRAARALVESDHDWARIAQRAAAAFPPR